MPPAKLPSYDATPSSGGIVRNPSIRKSVVRSVLAAAFVALSLAGCGGGSGGGGGVDTTASTGSASNGGTGAGTGGGAGSGSGTGSGTGTGVTTPPQSAFFASWTAPMLDATNAIPGTASASAQSFNNQSIRQPVRLSLGGDTLRMKVSNLFGKSAVTFSGIHVAKSGAPPNAIDTSTDRVVTFGGQASVTLAPGAEMMSDTVALPTSALSMLAVTMYFASPTTLPTVHSDGRQTTYIVPGDQMSAAAVVAAGADLRASYFGLTAIETSSTSGAKVVVAFGDSQTDGFASSFDANKRYPNQLDDRLKAAGLARTGVVNAGISGNRWLNDFAGPSGNSRFDRDVLGVTGATDVIILEGLNDIGFGVDPAPFQAVSAQQIIDSIAAAVAKAQARGLKAFVGTLLPYRGAGYFSEDGETKRQAVNAWIRANSAGADGVIDFAQVMASAADASVMNPAYDSGDHLHPNDSGYAAMAAAIDLSRL
jgi:lysophospholipase L1-like esterase